MDYQAIIDKYYPADDELRRVLLLHSRQVADRCLLIVKKHKELPVDVQFLEEAAMLHDIGIYQCDAPSIHCHGTEPYIKHGPHDMPAWQNAIQERDCLALSLRRSKSRLSAMRINSTPSRSLTMCVRWLRLPKVWRSLAMKVC